MLLSYHGLSGIGKSLAALWRDHLGVFVSSLLAYASVVVPPLAAEAVKLGLVGACSDADPLNCYAKLVVNLAPLQTL